jgi:hypothetical protein
VFGVRRLLPHELGGFCWRVAGGFSIALIRRSWDGSVSGEVNNRRTLAYIYLAPISFLAKYTKFRRADDNLQRDRGYQQA